MHQKKKWIYEGIVLAVFLSFLLSDSLWKTLSRSRSLRATLKELDQTTKEVENIQNKLQELHNNPSAYEQLVRQELGYLRPGEKEARLLNNKH